MFFAFNTVCESDEDKKYPYGVSCILGLSGVKDYNFEYLNNLGITYALNVLIVSPTLGDSNFINPSFGLKKVFEGERFIDSIYIGIDFCLTPLNNFVVNIVSCDIFEKYPNIKIYFFFKFDLEKIYKRQFKEMKNKVMFGIGISYTQNYVIVGGGVGFKNF